MELRKGHRVRAEQGPLPFSAPDLQKHPGKTGGWEEWSTLQGASKAPTTPYTGSECPDPRRCGQGRQLSPSASALGPCEAGPRGLTSGATRCHEKLQKPQVLEIATVWRFPGRRTRAPMAGAGAGGGRGVPRAVGGSLVGGKDNPGYPTLRPAAAPWPSSTATLLRFGSGSQPMRPWLRPPGPQWQPEVGWRPPKVPHAAQCSV